MPRLLILVAGLIAAGAAAARAEQAFPFKAYITEDNVEIRSGPGQNFYPTDKLLKGQSVEVYKRNADGWCAIKPPNGSFSWISGRVLKLEDDNLATVAQDDVAARVGSRLGEVRDVIQVRMKKGESVEIVDSADAPDAKSQAWYKIAPPSGEFRWVMDKFLDKQKPLGVADSELEEATVRQAGADENDPSAAIANQKASTEEYQNEVDRIDLELSMMVVEEPTVWAFDGLRIRAESLLERAETAADRGKTRLLLNKIAKFDDIKQRYDSVTAMREQNAASNRFLAGLQKTMEKAAALADPERQFDGVGQLQQVFAAKLGAPRFALVDEKGSVKYYVTPAPGVNLQNYLGHQVGITGTRGYMPEQRAQHITARHISSLENRMR